MHAILGIAKYSVGSLQAICIPNAHDLVLQVETATDSDDDSQVFEEAYSESMHHELKGSNVDEQGTQEVAGDTNNPPDCQPINLDMQVVSNLIESYTNQNGIPGPVGNLLGLMNLHVPETRGNEGPSTDLERTSS